MTIAEGLHEEKRSKRRMSFWRISTLVFLAACGLAGLAAASLIYLGRTSAHGANALAAEHETRLFEAALQDEQLQMARDQLTLAHWDRSYGNIVRSFNKDYVKGEFAEFLWSDFGHDRSFLVREDGRLLMSARKDNVDFGTGIRMADSTLITIAQQALARLDQIRATLDTAQGTASPLGPNDFATTGFATIDGNGIVFSAMAITPNDPLKMRGPRIVSVTAREINSSFIASLNAQLAFSDLAFHPKSIIPTGNNQPASSRMIASLSGEPLGAFTWTGRRPGERIWATATPLILALANIIAVFALYVAYSIGKLSTQLEWSEARNYALATRDSLSGLANRHHFQQGLDAAIGNLTRQPFVLVACDLDRFKAVNDTHGHQAGDTVIKVVAERLAGVVGQKGIVGRAGGDEFLILLTAPTSIPDLTTLAHSIVANVIQPIRLDNGAMADVGISMGLALAPSDGQTATAIMAAADAALYQAKARGRGTFRFAASPSNLPDVSHGRPAVATTAELEPQVPRYVQNLSGRRLLQAVRSA